MPASRLSKGTLAALAVALLAALPCAAFDLQGHRGARGLAPENTLAGFRRALEVGVTTLELDVGMSRDGIPVVAHDPRLNPAFTRDAGGRWIDEPGAPLVSLTLAEIRQHDVGRLRPDTRYARQWPQQVAADGERIPSLAELFERTAAWGAHRIRFNVETKINPLDPALTPAPAVFAGAVVETVRRHGMAARTTVQSFDWRTLREVQRLAPEIETAALTVRQRWLDNLADGRWTDGLLLSDHGGSVPRLVRAAGARTWSPHHSELDAASLREARSLGLKVVPWTVNEPADIERMLDLGVDGLITDHPERAREAMARRGMPLPPPMR